jgi:hypothetical protein
LPYAQGMDGVSVVVGVADRELMCGARSNVPPCHDSDDARRRVCSCVTVTRAVVPGPVRTDGTPAHVFTMGISQCASIHPGTDRLTVLWPTAFVYRASQFPEWSTARIRPSLNFFPDAQSDSSVRFHRGACCAGSFAFPSPSSSFRL